MQLLRGVLFRGAKSKKRALRLFSKLLLAANLFCCAYFFLFYLLLLFYTKEKWVSGGEAKWQKENISMCAANAVRPALGGWENALVVAVGIQW